MQVSPISGSIEKIVDLMRNLYTDTSSAVRIAGILLGWFRVDGVVKPRCRMVLDMFLCSMHKIMERNVQHWQPGEHIGSERLTDLDYAGDEAILAEMPEILALCVEFMVHEARKFRFNINWAKTDT